MDLPEVVAKLEQMGMKPRFVGPGAVRSRCPVHQGDGDSFAINERGGKLLFHCHAGCSQEQVFDALGLKKPEPARGIPFEQHARAQVGGSARTAAPAVVAGAVRPARGEWHEVKRWPMRGFDGTSYAHVRYEDGQGHKQVRWEPAGVKPAELPFYGAEQLENSNGSLIVVCEGEKAADALRGITGLVALGTVTGADGIPCRRALEQLRGRTVFLWPDNDDPGMRHMDRLGRALAPIAKALGVLLPTVEDPPKADAHDWMERHGLQPNALDARLKAVVQFWKWADARALAARPIDTLSLAELGAMELEPIQMLLGRGAIGRGYVSVMHGKGGLGKSYMALGLGIAVAHGLPFYGMPTQRANVAMLSYEVPQVKYQEHARQWCRELEVELPDNLYVGQLARALFDARDEHASVGGELLAAFVRSRELGLLIVDPLRRLHHANQDRAEEMQPIMDQFDAVAMTTQCGILVLHHDRKGPPGERKSDNSSDAFAGSQVIRDTPRSVFRLHVARGTLCLEFHKSNLGDTDPTIWLERQEGTPPAVTMEPSKASRQRKSDALVGVRNLLKDNDQGTTIEEIMEAMQVSRATAKRYIVEVGARNLRPRGQDGLYVLD